jgi:D-alanyl-D-alanine-carboxypeptidase/D-alanyl-D-alanine-endopeptidase
MPLFPSHPLARLALAVCFLLTIAGAGLARADDSPAAIQNILQERVELGRKTPGIVVGIVDEHGARVSAYGRTAEGGAPVDGNTVFEIGSATKVFTATLLADMGRKGDVALSDPVAKYLPATVTVPSRGGKQITLLDLATHMSGLPRMPTNHTPADKANPHADYTVAQLYAFLSATQLERDIGEKYEYSNLGVALLGHALALRAGTDYITLVRERILKPLGMHDTAIVLSADQQRRFATGHNRQLGKVPAQDFPTLAPAGALRSTANDMLKFVAANLGMNGVEAGLYAAMQDAQKPRLPAGQPTMQIGLNWLTIKRPAGGEIVWHNGATAGFHSFVGMNQAARKGVVVLSNSFNDIDDIGRHLLLADFQLAKMEPLPVAVALPEATLAAYAGAYTLGGGTVINILREGGKLQLQLPNQKPLEMQAKGETEFFLTVADVKVLFARDEKGGVASLTLRQFGRDQVAMRQR